MYTQSSDPPPFDNKNEQVTDKSTVLGLKRTPLIGVGSQVPRVLTDRGLRPEPLSVLR